VCFCLTCVIRKTHGKVDVCRAPDEKRTANILTHGNLPFSRSDSDKPAFLAELVQVARTVPGAWILLGDFNLTRDPSDKNTSPFNGSEAQLFNDTINHLELIEIPLLDRAYSWSSRREEPTIVLLDRCLIINLLWDEQFPNSSLTSLTHFAFDHVPLLLFASTKIPKSRCFRFENAWLHYPPSRTCSGAPWALPCSVQPARNLSNV
jgi:hypothetical protein